MEIETGLDDSAGQLIYNAMKMVCLFMEKSFIGSRLSLCDGLCQVRAYGFSAVYRTCLIPNMSHTYCDPYKLCHIQAVSHMVCIIYVYMSIISN